MSFSTLDDILAGAKTDVDKIEAIHTYSKKIYLVNYSLLEDINLVALSLSRKLGDYRRIVRSLNNLSWAMMRQNKITQCLAYSKEALQLCEENDFQEELLEALMHLGAAHGYAGNIADAIELNHRRMELSQKAGDYEGYAKALNDMGIQYADLGEFQTAYDYYVRSLEISQDHELTLGAVFPYVNLAELLTENGEYEKALSYAKRGLMIAEGVNFLEGRIEAMTQQATAQARLGKLEESSQIFNEALLLSKENGHVRRSWVLAGKADLMYHKKDYAEAEALYIEAITYAEESKNFELLLQIFPNIILVFDETEQFEKAYRYQKRYFDLNSTIYNENAYRRAEILKVQYEMELMQRETNLARFEKEILEAQLRQQRQAEQEREKREELQIRLHREHEINELKQRILERIAHEFRSPLTVIRNSIYMLANHGHKLEEEKRIRQYEQIEKQFEWLTKLFDDIMATLSDTEYRITPSNIDIKMVCEQAIAKATHETGIKGRIDLKFETSRTLAYMDENILVAALSQLLANAIKFSEESVLFEISFNQETENYIFRIEDHGIGIPADEIELVFEPLYRGTNVGEIQGNGLGLRIANDYVELHDGRITIASQLNNGTTISAIIPELSKEPSKRKTIIEV